MQVPEPVSVAATSASLVSPPPQVVEEIFVSDVFATPFKFAAPTSHRTSQFTPDTTLNASFVHRSTTFPDPLQASSMPEIRDSMQPNVADRSANNSETTGMLAHVDKHDALIRVQREETSARKTVMSADDPVIRLASDRQQPNSIRSAAIKDKVEEMSKGKRWFDILPIVLTNIKRHNREHVRRTRFLISLDTKRGMHCDDCGLVCVCVELSLPRCTKCERVRDDHKAVIRCKQKGCTVLDHPLCLMCWESYHVSLEARQHRGQHTSGNF